MEEGNLFMNNSFEEMELQAIDYVISSFIIFVCVFGLLGNALAMIVVLRNPGLKMASVVFIFNLAVADFLFLLSMPFVVANQLMRYWVFKDCMCKVYFGLFGINLFASVYTLLAMSLDRYIAVCCMRWNELRTRRNSVICCLLIWMIATFLSLPLLLYANLDDESCLISWPENKAISAAEAYAYYTLILGFVLPLFLITIFYTSIIIRLRKKSPGIAEATLGKKKKRTRKVTFVVFCIILAFVVCWLPYWCMQIIILTASKSIGRTEMIIYQFATFLYICNSAINPILYGLFSNTFRNNVLGLLRCKKEDNSAHQSSRATTVLNSLKIWKTSTRKRKDTLEGDTNRRMSFKSVKEELPLMKENAHADKKSSAKGETCHQRYNCELLAPAHLFSQTSMSAGSSISLIDSPSGPGLRLQSERINTI
ncbi:neuropeptides B/W receptor type 2-like [Watersipora subatra]|uniref:neuropeptides B/W receptor type 2-like n=1 Tax=Watersipora subatra TaxID=2589382 RepID=UPI00355B8C21